MDNSASFAKKHFHHFLLPLLADTNPHFNYFMSWWIAELNSSNVRLKPRILCENGFLKESVRTQMRFPTTFLSIIIIGNPSQEAGHELRVSRYPQKAGIQLLLRKKEGLQALPNHRSTKALGYPDIPGAWQPQLNKHWWSSHWSWTFGQDSNDTNYYWFRNKKRGMKQIYKLL